MQRSPVPGGFRSGLHRKVKAALRRAASIPPPGKAVMQPERNRNMENVIRLLKAEEIECRAASVSEKGLSLLLYKDARVDQRILDEVFGIFGWKRSHQCINGSLYCTVEVFDKGNGCWVAKQDVGACGHTEKEKSQASDSFKRACFNWGIGRELYTAPFIWVLAGKAEIQKRGDRFCCNTRFCVASISYNADREISGLVVVDGRGQAVFQMGQRPVKAASGKTKGLSTEQMDCLGAELQRTGVGMEEVRERYHFTQPEEMSAELYHKVMKALARTKSVAA